MSWLSSWLHPERGYQAGQQQLNNYYNQGQGYLNPYNMAGQGQMGNLQEYIRNLMNPQALENKWIKGYKESESAKNLEGMAKEHGLDAASSMGLMGSSPALQAIQAGQSAIGAEDRQNYLNDMMQKYMAGSGLSSGMFNTGAGVAGNMANNANTMGQNSAQMAWGEQNAPGSYLNNLLGLGGGLLGGWLTNRNSPWTTGGR